MLAHHRCTPPSVQPGLVDRTSVFKRSAPITLVWAPAGYGKTQLLAKWCAQASERGEVAYALCSRLGETPSSLLELLFLALGYHSEFKPELAWQEQADTLGEYLHSAGPITLFLDDVHHLQADTSEADECNLLLSYLLDYRPPECHWVFAGRSRPRLADLEIKEMSGEVDILTASGLSLSQEELEVLSPGQGERLYELTSGWPLACVVLLRTEKDQWAEQRDRFGQNLLALATRGLSKEANDALAILGLVGWSTPAELEAHSVWTPIQRLIDDSSLVRFDGQQVMLHPLFSESYRDSASPQQIERAVMILESSARGWEALELISDPDVLASSLIEKGPELLGSGRYRLLKKLLQRATLGPELTVLQGQVAWYEGDPAAALEYFSQSARLAEGLGDDETAYRAWRAAGVLYIEAVCPDAAGTYLKRAYRALSPSQPNKKAEVLELLAENAVNLGRARAAHRYRLLARRWVQGKLEDLTLTARLLLRSGRIAEARGAARAATKEASHDGHRDPRLVESYLDALEGRGESAVRLASVVLEESRQREDRRTESIALTRLAHGHLLASLADKAEGRQALTLYSQSDTIAKTLGVERLRAEPLMGLALQAIWSDQLDRALKISRQGVEIADTSGDRWLATWLRLINAIAATLANDPQAAHLMDSVGADFRACHDRFGSALTDLWSFCYHDKKETARSARKHLEEFPFLLARPSLLAPPKDQLNTLLESPQPRSDSARLEVFCLGPLSLLSGGEAIPQKAFKRKKARELFVLMLTSPDTFFHREELAATLWPKASQKAALRDFRVALHALSEALEPEREKNTTAFCIERREDHYRLCSERMSIDTERFVQLTETDNPGEWKRAVGLFRGQFCEDYRYLEPLDAVRQHYDHLFLVTAEKLGRWYLDQARPTDTLELAQRMIQLDKTWEPAYRLLLRSHHQLGHEHLLPRTFTRCLETLEEELGVEPSEETFDLARELLGDQLALLL